jgi:hypothetical protein
MKKRKYSIFEVIKEGMRKSYKRVSTMSLSKEQAVKYWQPTLQSLSPDGNFYELRPAKDLREVTK